MPWSIERDGNVAVVTMNSHKVNVQNRRFFQDMHDAFDRLECDFADAAIVLTAAGSTFSAGLDFEASFEALASTDLGVIERFFADYRATNMRLFEYPRPTVAAINGHAFAGGLITALSCDQRVCAGDARLCLNEVPIGIPMPAAYIEIIRHALGTPVASLLTLTGKEITPVEARALGVVHAVTGAAELIPAALTMARAVPPDCFDAYACSKRALQAPALERIAGAAAMHDSELAPLLTADHNVRARARRYEQIKGKAPAWARRAT
jgi:enoyl-CoA hydratase